MAAVQIWIEGVEHPFVLRFKEFETARAMAARISLEATNSNPRSSPYVDDGGYELAFRLSLLRAIVVDPNEAA